MSIASPAPIKKHRIKDTTVTKVTGPLSADELRKLDAYWRASNYLSVGSNIFARQSAAKRAA